MYEVSKELTELAYKLAEAVEELNYIKDLGITFCVLTSDKEKKSNHKIIFAECKKISEFEKTFCPYEFVIVVYLPNAELLDDNQMKVLLWHEMRHIGVEEGTGEPKYYVYPHDIEDFRSIIDKFGMDWATEGKILPDILKGGGA